MSSALLTGDPRSPLRWVWVTSRHNLPQPAPGSTPAPDRAPALSLEDAAGRPRRPSEWIATGTGSPCRQRGWRPRSPSQNHPVPNSQINPQHGGDTGLIAGLCEPHCTIESVAVGQSECRLTQCRGAFHQRRRGRCAVTQREAGRHVQVGKGFTHCRVAGRLVGAQLS